MKTITAIFVLLFSFSFYLHSQDKYPAVQVTADPAQQGFPSWSPDGRSLVYSYTSRTDTLGENGLWVLSMDDRQGKQVFAGIAEHPKWSPDGRFIVFDADTGKSIKMIPAGGGKPINILPDSIRILNGGLPCWSPDGSKIAFKEGTTQSVYILDINTGLLHKILQETPLIPLPGCWTRDGKAVLLTLFDRPARKCTLWRVAADGSSKQQITGHEEGLYRHIELSPDGMLLIYAAVVERNERLWIMPSTGGKSILLVSHPGWNEGPNWSPDGKHIAFTSTRSGNFDIWMMAVDPEQLRKEVEELNKP